MNIPKSWKEIKLSKFQQLAPHIIVSGEMTRIQEYQYWIKICDLLELDVDLLTRSEFEDIVNQLRWINSYPEALNFKFSLNGIDYGFDDAPDKWQVNQYSDSDSYTNGMSWVEIMENLHYLNAIFFLPIDKTTNELIPYLTKDIDERAELFKEHLPADIAYSIYLFFCLLAEEFTKIGVLSSLQKELENL